MLRILYNVLAIPVNFFAGFLVGAAGPVAAIAAMVFGVRFLTGKMPFLSLSPEEGQGERHLAVELIEAEQAGDRFAAEKQKVVDDLGSLRDELKALMEEAKAQQAAAGAGQEGAGD
jgi:hypothetical protein